MIPYRDENQAQRTAIVTIIFIGLNVIKWLVVQGRVRPCHWPGPSMSLGLFPES